MIDINAFGRVVELARWLWVSAKWVDKVMDCRKQLCTDWRMPS